MKAMKKEIKRLQDDLNKTEENYNEQCLLYKQKLNDERQRTVEVKEQMTELRDSYDKKINKMMKSLVEKDEEIMTIRSDLRGNNIFQRASVMTSPDDENLSGSVILMHDRCQTPTTNLLMNNYNNSSFSQNPMIDSSGSSLRSSINQKLITPMWLENLSEVEYKALRKYQQIIDHASRVE